MNSKNVLDGIVYADSWRGYNVVDVSHLKQLPINHFELFADKRNHSDGIENFKGSGQTAFVQIQRDKKANFGLFFREWEWRFNNHDQNEVRKRIVKRAGSIVF